MADVFLFVPGFGGSVLSGLDKRPLIGGKKVFYPDQTQVAQFGFAPMQLPYNTGGSFVWGELFPSSTAFSASWTALGQSVTASGAEYRFFPYDWRKSILENGDALWNEVQSLEGQYDRISVVGHSMGGLLALRAWNKYVNNPNADKWKAIVALGSPFGGAYAAPNGLASVIGSLIPFRWGTGLTILALDLFRVPVLHQDTLSISLQKALASWPTLYEMAPVNGWPGTTRNPFSDKVYVKSTYTAINPYVDDVMFQAAQNVQKELSLGWAGPQPIWTYVVGTGTASPEGLDGTFQLGVSPPVIFNTDGDGAVYRPRAIGKTPGRIVELQGDHRSLISDPAIVAGITTWVKTPAIVTDVSKAPFKESVVPIPPQLTIEGPFNPPGGRQVQTDP